MAFFQFRKGRDEHAAKPAAPQTIEAMRKRAMHRLVGAAVLVLAGVIGFPLVFDHQPRPIPVDLPIEIADKNKVKPLAVPAMASTRMAAPVSAPVATPAPVAAGSQATAPIAAPEAAPNDPAVIAAPVAAASVPATLAAKTTDASKAQALLEGKDVSAQAIATDGRFVVQVGAFAEPEKVREVRQKVEGAGLKTYTQVVETKDGSRTRVRVGPFPDKSEATRVAEKIRKLDLPAAILTL